MADSIPEKLEDYKPSGKTYDETDKYVLFGVDSDGCVDKGMRYKHGGPFPRAGIEVFNLGAIAEQWRIAWTFVNEIRAIHSLRISLLRVRRSRYA